MKDEEISGKPKDSSNEQFHQIGSINVLKWKIQFLYDNIIQCVSKRRDYVIQGQVH